MDYDKYNYIRNTDAYRFLRDNLKFSRKAAILTLLPFTPTGAFRRRVIDTIKTIGIVIMAAIVVFTLGLLIHVLKEQSKTWNEQLRTRTQQEQRSTTPERERRPRNERWNHTLDQEGRLNNYYHQ